MSKKKFDLKKMNYWNKIKVCKAGVETLDLSAPIKDDIWLINDIDINYEKKRPVIISSVKNNVIYCYKCTTKEKPYRPNTIIPNGRDYGLNKETYVIRKIMTISPDSLIQYIGHIPENAINELGL